jgi:hypothetical protein
MNKVKPFKCSNRTQNKPNKLIRQCECQYCKCLTLNIRDFTLAYPIFRNSE